MGPVLNLMSACPAADRAALPVWAENRYLRLPWSGPRAGCPPTTRKRPSHLVRSSPPDEPPVPIATQLAPERMRVATGSSNTPPIPEGPAPERVTDHARAARRSVTASTITVPR